MKQRISCLHIADYAPPFRSSFLDSLIYLAKQLEKRECRTILMVPSLQKWNSLLTDNGISVLCIPIPSLARPVELLRYLLNLRSIAKKEKVKIIHCHFNLKYLSFSKFFVGRDVKIIWHWRNMPKTKTGESHNFLKPFFRDFFYRMVSKLVDRHIAISSELYTWLSSVSNKVSFIPNAISFERFDCGSFKKDVSVLSDFGIPKDMSIVCSVANFRIQKDHITLVKAAKDVIRQKPNVYFVLVGDGPTRKGVERFVEGLEITNKITFTGIINNVERITHASDIIILSTLHEGFPMAILEAMALEKPVVATDVGGCRDMVTPETGFLVGLKDHIGMADKILWLLDNPEKAKEMGRNGRRIVKARFSLEVWSKKIIELYWPEDSGIGQR